MFILYRMAFAPPRESSRIELLFTHKNRFSGAISVTKPSYAAPICKVVSYCHGRDLSNKMFFNGNRHFCVCIHAAILSYLRFGTFLICLSHDGQTHTCRWCNRRGHFAKDCPNTVCFNCDGLGHKVNECTREELLHLQEPHASRTSPSPVASP